jgi:N-acetylmuramoyl-L-alanine amidase
MALTQNQQDFILKVGALAAADMQKNGILASLTIAQAILESGWGTSALAVKANALFGIKADSRWSGRVYSVDTKECYDGANFVSVTALFRAYDNWEQSLADHSAFLLANARYAAVIGECDYKAACTAIKAAGYATDPDYATKLINIIESYGLTAYDAASGKEEPKMKIYLSPSNQPGNQYVVGNTTEKIQMEAVAARVKTLLDSYNCETVMATLSMGITASERPQEAKNKGCNFYLAIHSNAAGGTPPCTAAGAVGFYHPDSAQSKALMTTMVSELNAVCPIKANRGSQVVSGMTQFDGVGYGEIRSPMQKGVPSALIEVNFHDNPATAQWIIDNKDTIAGAIVKAVVSVFGITKKSGITPTPTPTPTPAPAPSGWFRVRKTWADVASQKGAFTILDNAKRCADQNPGYSVFDESGKVIYGGAPAAFNPYLIKITTDSLNIRKGPGTNNAVVGVIEDRGVYTIVDESNGPGATRWGKLKSGAGWISLDFTQRR